MKQRTNVKELIGIIVGNIRAREVDPGEAVFNAAMASLIADGALIEAINRADFPEPQLRYSVDPIH